ncbi:MAG: L,D-transpeptidase [Firmicutes bacterium]|nr:L,D-transpeptidase [Bacillota bacterium]
MKKQRRFICLLCAIVLTLTTVLGTPSETFGASKSKYWIKVNTQANVVTVYKKANDKWKPYRAMLCSTGTGKGNSYEATPKGTFYVQSRWDWGAMVGGVYARYVVQFYGDFLFHSVPYEEYKNPKSVPTKEYNKLGKDASHGCVRLSLMDAKWIYDNIPRGTKVTVYNSKNPGPLGKPQGIKVSTKKKYNWDPTDPNKKNKTYQLPKPVITISKSKKTLVKPGSAYKLKSGVTAKDPNTFQNLTSLVTVSKVRWYNEKEKKYVEKKFTTDRRGLYKITYKVKYKYGGTTYKTLKIQVADTLSSPSVTTGNDSETGLVTLKWKAVQGAAKYIVYRGDTKTGSYKKMYTTTETKYTNTYQVVPGTTYYYKVKAIAGDKKHVNSNYSKVVTGTALDLSTEEEITTPEETILEN